MELFIFGRFHARAGHESAVEEALRNVVAPSREEAGCLSIQAFRSAGDPRLFYIHSRWVDEAAFNLHAGAALTVIGRGSSTSVPHAPIQNDRAER